jgi:hypothetical protein
MPQILEPARRQGRVACRAAGRPRTAADIVHSDRRHANGSTETFSAEGDHLEFGRIVSGVSVDLRITRISGDERYPIEMRYHLYTRTEGEDGFP